MVDLLSYSEQLKIKREEGKKWIWDDIRKKWYVWQPEELVRQLLILFLIDNKKYNKNRIKVEKAIQVNGQERRCDILIYDKEMKPYILVECKRPEVKLNQKVIDQAAIYNIALQVPYLIVSNGIENYCCQIDFEQKNYDYLEDFPLPI